jgi:signal transduction histidine kinase
MAMEISESIGRMYNYTSILHLIGDVYKKMGDNIKSVEYLENAFKHAEKQGYKRLKYLIHRSLSESFSQLGDSTKSLFHYKEYSKIKDDIQSEEKKQAISELQLNFDLERTQKEKELAEREKELYYLKNVKLEKALEKVETLNDHLIELDYEKNEMLGIVAHDLRNPISTIIMIANIYLKEAEKLNEKEVREYAHDIKTTSNKMINLIKDLLDINAMESGKLNIKTEPVDICQTTVSVIDEFQERAKLKDIKLEYVSGRNGLKVNGDNDATVQILDNLISNAVKYTQKGGNVEVRVNNVNGCIRVEVEDNGPGIKGNEKDLLFKKFSKLSAKPTGGETSTGLGLSIVKKLTEAMHGKVWCESVEGKGSVFVVEFDSLKK